MNSMGEGFLVLVEVIKGSGNFEIAGVFADQQAAESCAQEKVKQRNGAVRTYVVPFKAAYELEAT